MNKELSYIVGMLEGHLKVVASQLRVHKVVCSNQEEIDSILDDIDRALEESDKLWRERV